MADVNYAADVQHTALDSFCLPVEPETAVEFSCAGCGACCRKRKDLRLSGYDLFEICRGLSLPPKIVARSFCTVKDAPQQLIPELWLKPVGKTADCPFYYKKGCSIYNHRPLACRLYPFAQQISEDGSRAYFSQQPTCGTNTPGLTLQEYLIRNDIPQREKFDTAWAEAYLKLNCYLEQLKSEHGCCMTPILKKRILSAFYYNFAIDKCFLSQLERNLEKLYSDLRILQHK